MFNDDKQDLPPAYSESSSSYSVPALKDTSHNVTLTVLPPSSRNGYIPGTNLNATLIIPSNILGSVEGNIECRMEGKSSVEIMGKPRYQAAQLVNASMGGAPVPIVGREQHLFALSTISIPIEKRIDSGQESNVGIQIPIPPRRTCTCSPVTNEEHVGINGIEEGIMPTLGSKEDFQDRNRVTWKLKVSFARKGILKRDIKLSIEIPISLPLPSPRKQPLVTSTNPDSPIEAILTIYPSQPSSSNIIPFRLTLPEQLNDSDPTLKISIGLCKHTWTKGIDTSLGLKEGHDYPGIMVGTLSLDRSVGPGRITVQRQRGREGMVVEGEYEVGEGMKSVRGCGLRVGWSLQAQVRSNKLDRPIVLSQVIQLPHYTSP